VDEGIYAYAGALGGVKGEGELTIHKSIRRYRTDKRSEQGSKDSSRRGKRTKRTIPGQALAALRGTRRILASQTPILKKKEGWKRGD